MTDIKYSFLPFGFGQRQCIGRQFAIIVMVSMVASVLKNLNIEHTLKTIKGILMRNLIQTFFLKRKIFRQTMESQWHPAKKYI